ncbi:hypothetical protein QUF58_02210 [Anaerolineales bacterium HSG24]|nr:hypothetical protein [Anaerolineales bacterium HSG24]
MTTLTLDKQHVDILEQFGDIQELLQTLVHRYVLEQTQQKIEALQNDIDLYEKKYGLSYQKFERNVATDESFIQHIETIDFLWERDSNIWLYTIEELKAWQTRLANISNA